MTFSIEGNNGMNPAPVEVNPPSTGEFTPQSLGGALFSPTGDLLNSEGVVIKSAAEVAALKTPQTPPATPSVEPTKEPEPEPQKVVELIDAPVLSLSAEGDIVNDKGEIVHKKGTFDYDEKTGEVSLKEAGIVNSLATKFRERGFVLTDDAGQPMTFEDDEESYAALAERLGIEQANRQFQKIQETYPELAALQRHLELGKSAQEFYQSRASVVDYTKVEVPVSDVEGRLNIIKEQLTKVANNTPETVQLLLQAIKDRGEVDKHYNSALTSLKSWQQESQQRELQEYQTQVAQQQASIEAHWQNVNGIVKIGKLADDVVIPEAERAQFFKYISSAIDEEGNSQAVKDYREMAIENRLMLDYLLYKKLNIDSLVKAKVAQEKVNAFKARQSRFTIANSKPATVQQVRQYDGISIENLS